MIQYVKSNVSSRPTWRTPKFGNLLSDTYQGEVQQDSGGEWNGWMIDWSRSGQTKFKLGLASKRAAVRWVNARLREVGVK